MSRPLSNREKKFNWYSDNPRWKGGRIITSQGYVLIKDREHPHCNCDGYIAEHRLVMEKHLGRYLETEENIHHLNNIKDDNRIENLVILNPAEHARIHYYPDKLRKPKGDDFRE